MRSKPFVYICMKYLHGLVQHGSLGTATHLKPLLNRTVRHHAPPHELKPPPSPNYLQVRTYCPTVGDTHRCKNVIVTRGLAELCQKLLEVFQRTPLA
jgi:hypothetical protein